ncbi:hypothetical protein BH10BDE1_BH10BDE1_13450 [soil metagenome]
MKNEESLQPPKSNEERTAKLEKELHPSLGLPQSNHIATEDQPSPQMHQGQADFMKPERADRDSNKKSGAL